MAHTYAGALLIALATMAAWLSWVRVRPECFDNGPVSNLVMVTSALFGTLSHVWLDSQFHAEMARLTPSTLKLWQHGDATTPIETACMVAAELALLIYVMKSLLRRIWQWSQVKNV